VVLGVLSTAGYAVMHGFWPFLLTRLAWGAAWTLINVSGMAMVVDMTTGSNRGRWMGFYNTSVLVGLALGPVLGAFLVDAFGFNAGMVGCAGVTAIGLLVALLALPETSGSSAAREPAPSASASRRNSVRSGSSLVQSMELLRSNAALLSALLLFLISQFAGDGIVLSTVSLLLSQRFGESVAVGGVTLGIAAASGLVLGVRSLLAGVAGPLAGRISDGRSGRWAIVACGLISSILGFGLLAYDSTLWAVALGVVLSAIGTGTTLAALAALVGDLTPPGREGTVMGAYAAAGDVGSTAGPFLAFALVSSLDLRWIYLFCSVLFLLGLGLVWGSRRWRQTV
jgi:MFS family permease